MSDWQGETIADLAGALTRRETTSVALTEWCLERIATLNPRLNAFITVTADRALAAAHAADRARAAGADTSALHGIPVSLKDLIDEAGVVTTAGSRVRHDVVATTDATVTRRLREAGAVFVGKTNLHEFAFGTTNEDSGFGAARNPVDDTRVTGGSSGGSASAVATGMSIASIGSDTGGSIRIPAAACGVVGLKPGWGEIPADGAVPLSRQLDHLGPIARTVTDAWLVHETLAGRAPRPDARLTARPLAGTRIGLLRGYFAERLDTEVEAVFDAAVETLRREGAIVEPVEIPHARDIGPVYLHLVLSDAAAYHAETLARRPRDYTPNVRIRLEMGRYVLAEDYVRALRGMPRRDRQHVRALRRARLPERRRVCRTRARTGGERRADARPRLVRGRGRLPAHVPHRVAHARRAREGHGGGDGARAGGRERCRTGGDPAREALRRPRHRHGGQRRQTRACP